MEEQRKVIRLKQNVSLGGERGVTLIEVIVASAILVVTAGTLAYLISGTMGTGARTDSRTQRQCQDTAQGILEYIKAQGSTGGIGSNFVADARNPNIKKCSGTSSDRGGGSEAIDCSAEEIKAEMGQKYRAMRFAGSGAHSIVDFTAGKNIVNTHLLVNSSLHLLNTLVQTKPSLCQNEFGDEFLGITDLRESANKSDIGQMRDLKRFLKIEPFNTTTNAKIDCKELFEVAPPSVFAGKQPYETSKAPFGDGKANKPFVTSDTSSDAAMSRPVRTDVGYRVSVNVMYSSTGLKVENKDLPPHRCQLTHNFIFAPEPPAGEPTLVFASNNTIEHEGGSYTAEKRIPSGSNRTDIDKKKLTGFHQLNSFSLGSEQEKLLARRTGVFQLKPRSCDAKTSEASRLEFHVRPSKGGTTFLCRDRSRMRFKPSDAVASSVKPASGQILGNYVQIFNLSSVPREAFSKSSAASPKDDFNEALGVVAYPFAGGEQISLKGKSTEMLTFPFKANNENAPLFDPETGFSFKGLCNYSKSIKDCAWNSTANIVYQPSTQSALPSPTSVTEEGPLFGPGTEWLPCNQVLFGKKYSNPNDGVTVAHNPSSPTTSPNPEGPLAACLQTSPALSKIGFNWLLPEHPRETLAKNKDFNSELKYGYNFPVARFIFEGLRDGCEVNIDIIEIDGASNLSNINLYKDTLSTALKENPVMTLSEYVVEREPGSLCYAGGKYSFQCGGCPAGTGL